MQDRWKAWDLDLISRCTGIPKKMIEVTAPQISTPDKKAEDRSNQRRFGPQGYVEAQPLNFAWAWCPKKKRPKSKKNSKRIWSCSRKPRRLKGRRLLRMTRTRRIQRRAGKSLKIPFCFYALGMIGRISLYESKPLNIIRTRRFGCANGRRLMPPTPRWTLHGVRLLAAEDASGNKRKYPRKAFQSRPHDSRFRAAERLRLNCILTSIPARSAIEFAQTVLCRTPGQRCQWVGDWLMAPFPNRRQGIDRRRGTQSRSIPWPRWSSRSNTTSTARRRESESSIAAESDFPGNVEMVGVCLAIYQEDFQRRHLLTDPGDGGSASRESMTEEAEYDQGKEHGEMMSQGRRPRKAQWPIMMRMHEEHKVPRRFDGHDGEHRMHHMERHTRTMKAGCTCLKRRWRTATERISGRWAGEESAKAVEQWPRETRGCR